ncbi:peptide ABC transporter ATP-binding protein [Halorubrum sp. DTA46]|uniref:peptide ABC transporter ATP-binding protein n=1 Tax=Halorubrum sp. DTA46 TaxID=3402162 RepID=UPI003AACCAFB
MSGSNPRAPLSVVTDDLTLTVDGVEFDVHSTGARLFVEIDSVRDAIRVARSLPDDDAAGPTAFLTATGLATEFRVRGRTVAVLGTGARPGVVSRALGVSPAEVRVTGAVGAVASGLSAMRGVGRRLFR